MSVREVVHVFCDREGCHAVDLSGGARREALARCKRNGWRITKTLHYCREHNVPPLSEPAERLIEEMRQHGMGPVKVTGIGLQVAKPLVQRGILVQSGPQHFTLAPNYSGTSISSSGSTGMT